MHGKSIATISPVQTQNKFSSGSAPKSLEPCAQGAVPLAQF
jgi:hypothetical protein